VSTVLPAGADQVLSVQFTPLDSVNYNTPPPLTVTISVIPAPVISSGLVSAQGNVVTVGELVQFSSSAIGNVSWIYNFGDGTTAVSSNGGATHIFSPAGNYTVTVIATNQFGLATTQTLNLTVNPIGAGGLPSEIDSDGDGFTDAVEEQFATSPISNLSTPFNGTPAGEPLLLTVTKLSIKLNFVKAASDSIVLSGTLPLPEGYMPMNQKVGIDMGGIVTVFPLDVKGRSKTASNAFKLSYKSKRGVVAAQTAKFQVKLSKGAFVSELIDEQLTAAQDQKNVTRTVIVNVYFNLTTYRAQRTLIYSSKSGKSGSAK
jgi:PKD repeat protein